MPVSGCFVGSRAGVVLTKRLFCVYRLFVFPRIRPLFAARLYTLVDLTARSQGGRQGPHS